MLFINYLFRYYYQLIHGCKRQCHNHFCRSSLKCKNLSEKEASLWALHLAISKKSYFCDISPILYETIDVPYYLNHNNSHARRMTTFKLMISKVFGSESRFTRNKSPKIVSSMDQNQDNNDRTLIYLDFKSIANQDPQKLFFTINGIFSNENILTNCFLKSNNDDSKFNNSPDLLMENLNDQCIEDWYSGLVNNIDLKIMLTNATTSLIRKLYQNISEHPKNHNTYRDMVVYIILLLNPLLPDLSNSLYKHYVNLIYSLDDNSIYKLFVLLSKKSSAFKYFITLMHHYILCTSFSYNNFVKECINACEILKKMYEFNEKYNIVPYTAFYMENIMEKDWNIKHSYMKWKLKKITKNNDSGKYIFDFPFLLTPFFKACLFRIDSFIKMSCKLESTLLFVVIKEIFAQRKINDQIAIKTTLHLKIKVRRDHIIEDTLSEFIRNKDHLHKPLLVSFKNETGLDLGGVQKEFFQLLVNELFSEKYRLFKIHNKSYYWFDTGKFTVRKSRLYKLFGIILWMALYNGVILDIKLPRLFFSKLLGNTLSFYDLKSFDKDLYQGFETLLSYQGDIEALGLYFVVDAVINDKIETVPLIPNGDTIKVNNENVREYIDLYSQWILEKSIIKPFREIRKGFKLMCHDSLIQMLSPDELEVLICGVEGELDFNELKANCTYIEYTEDSDIIKWFWEIAFSMNEEQKKQLLSFTTGSSRIPVGGISSIPLKIGRNGTDTGRMPSAQTCFSLLLIPEYETKELLEKMLLNAIQYNIGFDLV